MSEFRVDRPGRYRARDGRIQLVPGFNKYGLAEDTNGSPRWYADTGRASFEKEYPYDLIAYLGPLEERETLCWNCSKSYPMHDPWCPFCRATNANVDQEAAQAERKAAADPAISDAAWAAIEARCRPFSRDVETAYYVDNGLVLRTREEWEQHTDANYDQQQVRIGELENTIAGRDDEIARLKSEIAALEKSSNHCEFCDSVIAVKAIAPAHPRIPLTTPQLDRYTTPMLGTQR